MTYTLRRVFVPLIFLLMVFGCTSENEYHEEEIIQQVELLTVPDAQALYEQYIGTASRLKSADESETVRLLPDWSNGQMSSDSNWYMVETPLEFEEGRQLKFLAPSVNEYAEMNTYPSEIRQLQTLLVMRNKKTGKNYAFVMLIIPELEYMLKKGTELNRNTYFHRESDLNGMVLYYDTDGFFVNGWVYEKGKITEELISDDSDTGRFTTKASQEHCYNVVEYVWDEFSGKWIKAYGIVCIKTRPPLGGTGLNNPYEDGFVDPSLRPDFGGAGTPSPPASNNANKDKKPEIRDDCPPNATTNSNHAETALKGNKEIESIMSSLKNYAVTKENEFTTSIDINRNNNYLKGDVVEGTHGETNIELNEWSVYNVHTHSLTRDASVFCYTGPSVEDIGSVLGATAYFANGGYNNLKGCIIFAYDGTEYLLQIDDRAKTLAFAKNNLHLFESNNEGFFANGDMQKEYREIETKLNTNGFSKQNAHDYALSFILDKYKTGLKIYKKEKGTTSFKETKTENINNEYKPKICK